MVQSFITPKTGAQVTASTPMITSRQPRKQVWQVRREENSRRWRNCNKSYRNYLLSLA